MDDITPRSPGVERHASEARSANPAAYGATHPGRVREENEDAFVVAPDLGLVVVADGVGGAGGGKLAADVVVSTVHRFFARESTRSILRRARPASLVDVIPTLIAAAEEAHAELRRQASTSGFHQMATTLATVVVAADHAFAMHAGDSRVYRLRDGELERVTEDHTAIARWEQQYGTVPPLVAREMGHMILRAVSARMDTVRPDIWVEPAKPGDLYLVATDGLTRVVSDDAIARLVLGAPDLESAAHSLLNAALVEGGPDNITAALLHYTGTENCSAC